MLCSQGQGIDQGCALPHETHDGSFWVLQKQLANIINSRMLTRSICTFYLHAKAGFNKLCIAPGHIAAALACRTLTRDTCTNNSAGYRQRVHVISGFEVEA